MPLTVADRLKYRKLLVTLSQMSDIDFTTQATGLKIGKKENELEIDKEKINRPLLEKHFLSISAIVAKIKAPTNNEEKIGFIKQLSFNRQISLLKQLIDTKEDNLIKLVCSSVDSARILKILSQIDKTRSQYVLNLLDEENKKKILLDLLPKELSQQFAEKGYAEIVNNIYSLFEENTEEQKIIQNLFPAATKVDTTISPEGKSHLEVSLICADIDKNSDTEAEYAELIRGELGRKIFLENIYIQQRAKTTRLVVDGVDILVVLTLTIADFLFWIAKLEQVNEQNVGVFTGVAELITCIAIGFLIIGGISSLLSSNYRGFLLNKIRKLISAQSEEEKELEKEYLFSKLQEIDENTSISDEEKDALRAGYYKRLRKLILNDAQANRYALFEIFNQIVKGTIFGLAPIALGVTFIWQNVYHKAMVISDWVPFINIIVTASLLFSVIWFGVKWHESVKRLEKLKKSHEQELASIDNEINEISKKNNNSDVNKKEELQKKITSLNEKRAKRLLQHKYEIASLEHQIAERKYKFQQYSMIFIKSAIACVLGLAFIATSLNPLVLVASLLIGFTAWKMYCYFKDNRQQQTYMSSAVAAEHSYEMKILGCKITAEDEVAKSASSPPKDSERRLNDEAVKSAITTKSSTFSYYMGAFFSSRRNENNKITRPAPAPSAALTPA